VQLSQLDIYLGRLYRSYGSNVYCEYSSLANCFLDFMNLRHVQGEIGVLDRKDMDSFAGIFVAYQKRGKSDNQEGEGRHVHMYLSAARLKLDSNLP
jgi:hypothetical protein